MAKQITADDVAQAEARLADAKGQKNQAKRQRAAEEVAELRSAFRAQEEAAGRRNAGNGPGGDAVKEA